MNSNYSKEEMKQKKIEDIVSIIKYHNKLKIFSILLILITISTTIFNLLSALVFKSYLNLIIGLMFEFILLIVSFLLNIVNGKFFDIFIGYTIEKDEIKWRNVRSDITEIKEFIGDIDDFVKKFVDNIEKNNKKIEYNSEKINKSPFVDSKSEKLIDRCDICDKEDNKYSLIYDKKERLIDEGE